MYYCSSGEMGKIMGKALLEFERTKTLYFLVCRPQQFWKDQYLTLSKAISGCEQRIVQFYHVVCQ